MSKNMQMPVSFVVSSSDRDAEWERKWKARQEQRDFTHETNKAFDKSDEILRVKTGNAGQCLMPVVPGAFRVGSFKK